jgi:hypothetical protein
MSQTSLPKCQPFATKNGIKLTNLGEDASSSCEVRDHKSSRIRGYVEASIYWLTRSAVRSPRNPVEIDTYTNENRTTMSHNELISVGEFTSILYKVTLRFQNVNLLPQKKMVL